MTDPLRGLRFDIYERVHLPDDVAAIGELEEIELVPHMKVLPQDDQVLLRGHLLLSGVYRPQDGAEGVSQMEHWIPVEITLPMNRVEKVEEIAVEIDNFDVDLMSERSLNVTGVLALRGIQVSAPQIPVWRDDSFTVVHQAPVISESQDTDEKLEERFERQAESEPEPAEWPPSVPEKQVFAEPEAARSFEPPPVSDNFPPDFPAALAQETGVWPNVRLEPDIEVEAEQQPAYDLEQWIRAQQAEAQSREPQFSQTPDAYGINNVPEHTGWGDLSSSRSYAPEISIEDVYSPVPEQKPEMKVALGAKPPEPPVRIISGVGFLSQLGEKGAAREAELQAMRSALAEAEESETKDSKSYKASTGDELEWTRLFISKGADAEPFTKVKMCIVQREDTLESIAARYNVQTRELQQRNRLSDPYLSAGQVLVIP